MSNIYNCTVPNLKWLGDALCDHNDLYNTKECNWDDGDCCPQTCISNHIRSCLHNKFDCKDPIYSTTLLSTLSPNIITNNSLSPIIENSVLTNIIITIIIPSILSAISIVIFVYCILTKPDNNEHNNEHNHQNIQII